MKEYIFSLWFQSTLSGHLIEILYMCNCVIIYYQNHDVSSAIGSDLHSFSSLLSGNFWLTCNIMDINNNSFQFIFYGRNVSLRHWFIQFVGMVGKFTFKYLHQLTCFDFTVLKLLMVKEKPSAVTTTVCVRRLKPRIAGLKIWFYVLWEF